MSDDYLNKPLSLDTDSSSAPSYGNESRTRTSTPAFASPYLNYDPRFMQQSQPEFIFTEGANKQRGRFELAFSQIGTTVMVGGAVGGAAGFYNGLRTTAALQHTGKLRRTQLLNHVMKQGSATANTVGVLAVMYSAFGVLLQFTRGKDDELNTVLAGTATGLLYKSSAGVRRCAMGGGVGLGISALYVLFEMSRNSSSIMPNKSFM